MSEIGAERRRAVGDPPNGVRNTALNVHTRALDRARGHAVAATEADPSSQLFGKEFELGTATRAAPLVVPALGLFLLVCGTLREVDILRGESREPWFLAKE